MAATDANALRNELGALKALLPSDPGNPALLRRCAQLAVELGEYAEALKLSSAALAAYPGDAEALFHRASALVGLKQFNEAAECLTALRSHGVGGAGVATNLALCYYALGDFKQASVLLDTLLEAQREVSSDVLRLAVSARHHLGDIDGAVALADAHSEAALVDTAVAGVYALAYLDAGRATDAARLAENALARDRSSVDALSVTGTVALSNMDSETAQRSFNRILEIAPGNGRALIGLGTIALLAQDMPRARTYLERGINAMPGHVGSWHVLGWTYLVSGDLDAAERTFNRALELDRNFAETHGALAAIHALRGRPADARKEIALAERLDREGLATFFAKAVLTSQGGNTDVTRSLIRAGIARLIPKVSTRAAKILSATARPPNHTRH